MSPSAGTSGGVFTARQHRVLAVLLVPVFMSLLAASSINVALPSL